MSIGFHKFIGSVIITILKQCPEMKSTVPGVTQVVRSE